MNAVRSIPSPSVDWWIPTDEIEKEVAASERNYQRLSKEMVHLGNGKTCITHESDCLQWIERIETMAKRIAQGSEQATQVCFRRASDSPSYKLTSLGRAICMLCREGMPLIERMCPSSRYKGGNATPTIPVAQEDEFAYSGDMTVRFNPYITVLLRACQRAMPALRPCGIFDVDIDSQRVRNALDRLVRFVRRACYSASFKRLETNRIRLERKNLRLNCRYMASGFAECSRSLVLRVDLYVRPGQKAWGDSRLAEQCIRRYLRAVAESRIVPDVRRWICKRERGLDRGIHFHLLVALDGHKHQNAAALSTLLGEAWVKRCGLLRASYFNCYARRHQYEYNALGSVHISDRRMLMGIREAIRYMVKGDGYVMTGYKRNLWRGIMPSASERPKRGAPRKAEHDMTFVDGILGNISA